MKICYGPRAADYMYLGHVRVERMSAGWRIVKDEKPFDYEHNEPMSLPRLQGWCARKRIVLEVPGSLARQQIGTTLPGVTFLAINK